MCQEEVGVCQQIDRSGERRPRPASRRRCCRRRCTSGPKAITITAGLRRERSRARPAGGRGFRPGGGGRLRRARWAHASAGNPAAQGLSDAPRAGRPPGSGGAGGCRGCRARRRVPAGHDSAPVPAGARGRLDRDSAPAVRGHPAASRGAQGRFRSPRAVELRDAWLETGWFVASTGQPVRRRPIGPDVVRVRAWADPTHPGNSKLLVETVYRPLADPSLPERELDRQVPRNHPVAIKVRAALQDLVKRYGGPPPPSENAGPTPSRAMPPRASSLGSGAVGHLRPAVAGTAARDQQ